jgi:hypothetical protein
LVGLTSRAAYRFSSFLLPSASATATDFFSYVKKEKSVAAERERRKRR